MAINFYHGSAGAQCLQNVATTQPIMIVMKKKKVAKKTKKGD